MKAESFKGIIFVLQFIESNAWAIFNYRAEIKSPVRAAVLIICAKESGLCFKVCHFPRVAKLKGESDFKPGFVPIF